MRGEPADLAGAMGRRRVLKVRLVALMVVSSGWGLWCWLLATEYVIDYRGEEWQVGLFSVLAALLVWALLILAAVATWRSLEGKPRRFG